MRNERCRWASGLAHMTLGGRQTIRLSLKKVVIGPQIRLHDCTCALYMCFGGELVGAVFSFIAFEIGVLLMCSVSIRHSILAFRAGPQAQLRSWQFP